MPHTSCHKESSINNIEWLGNTRQPGQSEHRKSLGFHQDCTPSYSNNRFFFRNIFKRLREILFTTLRRLTDKGKFSRNINGMCRRKFILQKCYELAVNPSALPFERHEQERVGLGDWEKWKEEVWLIRAGTCKPPSAKAGRKICKDANHLWVFT